MTKTRGFLFTVAVAATAFTFSCSSGDDNNGSGGDPSSSSNGGDGEISSSSDGGDSNPSSSSVGGDPLSSSVGDSSSSDGSQSSSSSESVISCAGFVEGTTRVHYDDDKKQFCDERDGKKYVYVEIGTQTWMAENLNYNATDSRCYGNLDSNCEIYGRLYNWFAAMNWSQSSTTVPSDVQGVCPDGWHLPSMMEWEMMTTYIGGGSVDGRKLKATSGWDNKLDGTSGNGTDDYGFSALPGGGYGNVGESGTWWSASEVVTGNLATGQAMRHGHDDAFGDYYDKSRSLSVRCLQD